ncbi:MAG: CvpA family protein [Clostridiales bacterium]|jgi:uncharacterized membrane protein required for colicin V production|nr:CvpA family protein [Clostridiales bacterium]
MAYILDGLVIIIFLLAVWLGYRRGFFKSIIQLAGCFIAVMFASTLSAPLSSGIYNQFISGTVQKQIEARIEKAGSDSVETALGGVLEELPDSVVNALSMFDLGTAEQVKDKLADSLDGSVTQISQQIEEKVVRPAAVSLLRVLCFFILCILFIVVVGVVASMVGKILRLPVLRQADGLLGGVLGAAQGVVLVFVAVTVMSLIASTSKSDDKINRAVIKDTVLVEAVEKANPMTGTLKSMFGAKSV